MKINLSDKIIAWLALFSGLTISAVAIWYSVAGLVSIFAAAVIPIIVMGVVLEISKLIATVWLKINWNRAPIFIRTYLLIAIAILMVITSMGIFGFLSKAHSDAGLVSGDVQAKIAVYDEKIKTERENIDAARKALTQMDAQVNERLSRSTDDKGAERAVQIRRQQQAERTRLQNDISRSQSAIAKLNEERAPIAAEVRKVEAEVGPIKYIASFIYGSNPDANLLEKAVTWVIIIIVAVFDPLAVILLLASQYSFQWFRKAREEQEAEGDSPVGPTVDIVSSDTTVTEQPVKDDFKFLAEYEPDPIPCVKCGTPLTEVPGIGLVCANLECDPRPPEFTEPVKEKSILEQHPYLNKPFSHFENLQPMVYKAEGDSPIGSSEQVVDLEPPTVTDHDDEHELSMAPDNEKIAMGLWKSENPDSSLKLQRRLLERGIITELPWMRYLQLKPDYVDETVEEPKKKDSDLVGERRDATGQENQGSVEYVQNGEQTKSSLWQRVKAKKDDK
jgi:hypothetical protein